MATPTLNPTDFPDLDIKAKGDNDFEINGMVKILQGFFGRQPGASLKDFAAEIQALSTLDKAQLCQGIKDGTLNYN